MRNKLRKILGYICWFWLLGGGCVLALFGFVSTWKLALSIFCIWGCSLIAFFMKCSVDCGILKYRNKK